MIYFNKDIYTPMATEQLFHILTIEHENYLPEAIAAIKDELLRRGESIDDNMVILKKEKILRKIACDNHLKATESYTARSKLFFCLCPGIAILRLRYIDLSYKLKIKQLVDYFWISIFWSLIVSIVASLLIWENIIICFYSGLPAMVLKLYWTLSRRFGHATAYTMIVSKFKRP